MREIPVLPSGRRDLTEWLRFIRGHAYILRERPVLLFQQAANQPASTSPSRTAARRLQAGRERRPWIRWINKPQVLTPRVAVLMGHSGPVEACAWAPDGRRIASSARRPGARAEIKIWNAHTGQEEGTWAAPKGGPVALTYSDHGERLILKFSDGSLFEGDGERCLGATSGRAFPSGFRSPDGKRIVSTSCDGSIQIKDATTDTILLTLRGPNMIDPAEHMNVVAREIRASGMGSTLGGVPNSVVKCVFSPDGTRIVSATDDETLQVWNAQTGSQVAVLEGHTRPITDCAFSPDGNRVISASEDMTLKIWDANTGAALATCAGHTASVQTCLFSADGQFIVSGSADTTLRIWDANAVQDAQLAPETVGEIRAGAFSPDGLRIVTGSDNGYLSIWDSATGKRLQNRQMIRSGFAQNGLAGLLNKRFFEHDKGAPIIRVCYSPDGSRILTACHEESDIVLWEAAAVTPKLKVGRAGREWVRCCGLSQDGRFMAAGYRDRSLRVWDTMSGEELLALDDCADSLVLSPDGREVLSEADGIAGVRLDLFDITNICDWSSVERQTISAVSELTVMLVEEGEGLPVAEFIMEARPGCIVWHPQGQALVVAGGAGHIQILRPENLPEKRMAACKWDRYDTGSNSAWRILRVHLGEYIGC